MEMYVHQAGTFSCPLNVNSNPFLDSMNVPISGVIRKLKIHAMSGFVADASNTEKLLLGGMALWLYLLAGDLTTVLSQIGLSGFSSNRQVLDASGMSIAMPTTDVHLGIEAAGLAQNVAACRFEVDAAIRNTDAGAAHAVALELDAMFILE